MDGTTLPNWLGLDPMVNQSGSSPDKLNQSADTSMLGLSNASTAPPDLLAPWNGAVPAATLGCSVTSSTMPLHSSADLDQDGFNGLTVQNSTCAMDSSGLKGYPRILTAAQLLEDSDDDSTWCGPPSEPEDSGRAEIRGLEALGLPEESKHGESRSKTARRGAPGTGTAGATRDGNTMAFAAAAAAAASTSHSNSAPAPAPMAGAEAPPKERPRQERKEPRKKTSEDRPKREPGEPQPRRAPPLIQPRGDVDGDNQKFVCVFQIGLDDDEEFCLVKRILGKAGNNMRRIAEECSAKVRLRGIGSGFLEGADGKEANMPLQLNVSCSDFDSYQGAVDRVATLLKDLYKHYRRYARSKGMEPPDVKVNVEEVRRDDLAYDLLQQKAQRSPSQRERDRRAREKERQLQRERERERDRDRVDREPPVAPRRPRSRERLQEDIDEGEDRPKSSYLLPDGQPIPTTAAGRRMVAKSGGAEHAAIVSAAAREAEKLERDRLRRERDDQREKEREERERKKKDSGRPAGGRSGRAAPTKSTKDGADDSWTEWKGAWSGGWKENWNSTGGWRDDVEETKFTKTITNVAALDGSWAAWKGTTAKAESSDGYGEKSKNSWGDWDPWASAAAKKHPEKSGSDTRGKR